MYLKPMKYKTFTWPHNPETYTISFQKRVAKHSYIGINQEELEDLGSEARVMSGSGAFFGPQAYNTFHQLATVFQDKEPGVLYHPVWANAKVIFTKLTVRNEPLPYFVEYDFEFMEHTELDVIKEVKPSSSGNGPVTKPKPANSPTKDPGYIVHIVKQGETLSGIGAKYGVPWRKIADDNKNVIKNPNVLQIGTKLVINSAKTKPVASKTDTKKANSSNTGDKAYDRFMNDFGDKLGKEEL